MMQSRLLIKLFAALLPCLIVVSAPAVSQRKLSSIKGKVFFSDVNQPISDALIILRQSDKPGNILETRTDEQGNYRFTDLAGGLYTISIRAPINRAQCRLSLQNLKAISVATFPQTFEADVAGFAIKAGREIDQDFDFACQQSPFEATFQRQVMQTGLKMLKEKRVPFDPELLLDNTWRAKLAAVFAQMPEMKKLTRVTNPMSGVYLAGTILLPSHVELSGDTFMLVGEFAPLDENSNILITGPHQLFIFIVGDKKQYQVMARRQGTEFLKVDVAGPCGVSGVAPVFRLRTFRCGRLWDEGIGAERK